MKFSKMLQSMPCSFLRVAFFKKNTAFVVDENFGFLDGLCRTGYMER